MPGEKFPDELKPIRLKREYSGYCQRVRGREGKQSGIVSNVFNIIKPSSSFLEKMKACDLSCTSCCASAGDVRRSSAYEY